ncbi:MAG: purine-nucleoside phosphorylase, partial [Ignavibacteria bacterium]|nr:purine-nucleoside phosphorylase [Ignavibacteria bacterium]
MKIKTGIILGSGLGNFAKELSSPEILFEDNSGFHKVRILKGNISDNPIAIFSGRKHYYEGYSSDLIMENVNF